MPAATAPIARDRLANQGLSRPRDATAAAVVARLGGVQAQEYGPALWALALRMRSRPTAAQIEQEVDEGRILRTHVLRPTWHFVAPADIRWMLELTAPHVHRAMRAYHRQLELDQPLLTRAMRTFERSLRDGRYRTRAELSARLGRTGINARGQRLAHIVMHAELEGLICSGPRRGRDATYALLAERAPGARRLPRDEAVAELATRFLRGHGPATVRDFNWWSGLPMAEARRGVEESGAAPLAVGGLTYWAFPRPRAARPPSAALYLLPVYDEYLVAYRDRVAVPHGPGTIVAGRTTPILFQHAIVSGGRIVGTWRPSPNGQAVTVTVAPIGALNRRERRGIADAAAEYARFLERPVTVTGPS